MRTAEPNRLLLGNAGRGEQRQVGPMIRAGEMMTMIPLTNSEIAARAKETDKKFGSKTPTAQHGPTMHSYTVGRYCVAWTHPGVPAEVRDESGAVIHTGSRDECLDWAKAKNA